MNKRFLLFLVVGSLMCISTKMYGMKGPDSGGNGNGASEAGQQALAGAGVLMAYAAISYVGEKVGETAVIKKGCQKIDIDPLEASKVVGLATGLLAGSFLTNEETSWLLRKYAARIPLATAVYLMTNSRIVNGVLGKLPFGIGDNLVCQNKDCTGSCNQCKLRSFLKGVASYKLVEQGLPWALEKCALPVAAAFFKPS
jgi:hypothetical protein